MPTSTRRGWTFHAIAVPLLGSLILHGILFAALWLWPSPSGFPTLAIESERMMVDTCVLDTPSAKLGVEREWPEDLVPVDVVVGAQLKEAPPIPQESSSVPGPKLVEDPTPARTTGTSEPSSSGADRGRGGDLFPLPAASSRVVYVLDRSVSMGLDRKLDFARRELISRLRRLPSSIRFQVIDYNAFAASVSVEGQRGLLPAESSIVEKAVAHLLGLEAEGVSNHLAALRRALDLQPDAIYFLTDAGDLQPREVAEITRKNRGRSAIHTLELTRRRAALSDGPLAQLARENGGTSRRVWLRSAD